MFQVAEKFFLSISTATAITEAVNNGLSILTVIALAGATYGWGALVYPIIRGAVAKWGVKRAAAW
jgi:hypothetical protein